MKRTARRPRTLDLPPYPEPRRVFTLAPPSRLDAIAPRLGAAYREVALELAVAKDERRYVRAQLLRLEAVVAHRELVAARACSTRNVAYMQKRQAKLEAAQRGLADLRKYASGIGVQ